MKSSGAVAGALASIALAGCVADIPANDRWMLEVWDTGYAQADWQLPSAPGLPMPPARTNRQAGDDDSVEVDRATAIVQAALGENSAAALPLPTQPGQSRRSDGANASPPSRRAPSEPGRLPPVVPLTLARAGPTDEAEWSDEMPRSDWAADQVLPAEAQPSP